MSRPRILIPIPTSFDEPYNQANWHVYAEAVEAAGGDAVRLPLTHSAQELEALAAEADGILLPGSGADVAPEKFGAERIPECNDADPMREATDWALLESAARLRKPLLGICFGTQSMNVFYGGTLHQDIDPVPVNHGAGRSVVVAHTALFEQKSRLGSILQASGEAVAEDDAFSKVPVNSSHHQAIAIAGDGLRVVARCPQDSVIEAVEGDAAGGWLVGVQWHPERTYANSAASRAIFAAFLEAARS